MKNKLSPPLTTILSDIKDEVLSEDEHAKLVAEWTARTLDQLFLLAVDSHQVAEIICKTAIKVGNLNSKYLEIINEGLKKNNGRPNKNSIELDKLLLIHYAHEFAEFNVKSKALGNLIEYQRRMTNTMISNESMENKISKALKNMQEGKFSLYELPEWAQPTIQERIDKGAKKKFRKSTQVK